MRTWTKKNYARSMHMLSKNPAFEFLSWRLYWPHSLAVMYNTRTSSYKVDVWWWIRRSVCSCQTPVVDFSVCPATNRQWKERYSPSQLLDKIPKIVSLDEETPAERYCSTSTQGVNAAHNGWHCSTKVNSCTIIITWYFMFKRLLNHASVHGI